MYCKHVDIARSNDPPQLGPELQYIFFFISYYVYIIVYKECIVNMYCTVQRPTTARHTMGKLNHLLVRHVGKTSWRIQYTRAMTAK